MKNARLFSFLFLLMLTSTLAKAQSGNGNGNYQGPNGNAVVSEVKVYNDNNGTGTIEVRVSGNLAYAISGGGITISGDRISGTVSLGTDQSRVGSDLIISPSSGNGSSIIVSGNFPMLPRTAGNSPDFVDVNIELSGRVGNNTVTINSPHFTMVTYLSY
jgi:hypothetical protein